MDDPCGGEGRCGKSKVRIDGKEPTLGSTGNPQISLAGKPFDEICGMIEKLL